MNKYKITKTDYCTNRGLQGNKWSSSESIHVESTLVVPVNIPAKGVCDTEAVTPLEDLQRTGQ